MGFFDELKRLASPYEDEEEELDDFEPMPREEKKRARATREESPAPADQERRGNKVVNIHTTTQLQVVLAKPDRYESGREIADHLRSKRTVVLNLESLSGKDVARRLLDFLAGVAYASDGRIERVAVNTYIITPFNVDLVGDLVADLENNGLYNF